MTLPTTPPLLTKREYYAALAMQGLIIAREGDRREWLNSAQAASLCKGAMPWEKIITEAVGYADALLAKLAAACIEEDPTWTPYDGGPMPCGPATQVQVKYRCGETGTPDRADFYLWSWTDEPYDIVAWRKACES